MIIVILAYLSLHIQSSTVQVSARDLFLQDYCKHADVLIQFYSTIRLNARKAIKSEVDQTTQVTNYVYHANGFRRRVDNESRSVNGRLSRVFNPEVGHFVVHQELGEPLYKIGLTQQKAYGSKPIVILDETPIPSLTYCIMNEEIKDFARLQNVRIKEYQHIVKDDKPLAQLAFELTWPGDVIMQGHLLFDCERHWTVLEGSYKQINKPSQHIWTIEYEGTKDGISLPKKVMGRYFDEKGQLSQTYTVEVLSLTPGPVPEREFTLAAFGLSDAVFQPYVPPWYYVQLVLVIAGLLAFCLWQWRRKHLAHRSLHFQDPKG